MRNRICLSLDENLIRKVDSERGEIPRSRFVEKVVVNWLKKKEKVALP